MHSKAGRPPTGLDAAWGLPPESSRGPSARYTVHDVAAAAVALADADGLAAVTLGAVAHALGLTTTALYRYVESKDVLVELMADHALGAPPEPTSGSWQEAVRAWARALRAAHLAHPWLAQVPAVAPPRRPGPYLWWERLATQLAGVARPQAVVLMIDCLVRGYAGVGVSHAPAPWLGPLLADRHPGLAAPDERSWSDGDREFDDAVEIMLRGISASSTAMG